MATRLIGTDSTDPWLPAVVRSKATQARIDDAAGLFDAVDVEAALAEIQGNVDRLVISGGGIATASTSETIAGTDATKAVTPAGLAGAHLYVDVRKHGAKGDGSTDDTAAIQAAIAAAAAAGGGVVAFGVGIFPISTPLDLLGKTGVQLQGAGILATVIRQSNLAVPVVQVQGSYIAVRGMQLRYATQSTTAGANALELRGIVSYCDFRDLYLWNCNIGVSYGGAVSPTGEFTNSWTNLRIGPFNASAIKLQPIGTQGTGSHWSNIYISNWTGTAAGACTDYPLYLQLSNAVFNQLNIEWCNTVAAARDLAIFQQCAGGVVVNKLHMEGNVLPTARAFITTFSSAGCTVQINALDLVGNVAATGNVGIVRPGAGTQVTLTNTIVDNNTGIAATWYTILDSSVATGAVVIVDNLSDPDGHIDGFSLSYVGSAHARGYKGAAAGFFGATPVARPTVPAAATDPATTMALANALRTALISLGLVA